MLTWPLSLTSTVPDAARGSVLSTARVSWIDVLSADTWLGIMPEACAAESAAMSDSMRAIVVRLRECADISSVRLEESGRRV